MILELLNDFGFLFMFIACGVAITIRFWGSLGASLGAIAFGTLAATNLIRQMEFDLSEYWSVLLLINLAAEGCLLAAILTGRTRQQTQIAAKDVPTLGTTGRGAMSLLSVLFSFNGRISRSEYWLKGFLVLMPLGILTNILVYAVEDNFVRLVGLAISVFSIWPSLAILVKRWHDRNHSAWWLLTLFIPILSIGFAIWIVIEVWFLKGTTGTNSFGRDPLQPSASQKAIIIGPPPTPESGMVSL